MEGRINNANNGKKSVSTLFDRKGRRTELIGNEIILLLF